MNSEGRRGLQGVRTHSLSALSSLASPGDLGIDTSFGRRGDSIWESPPLFAPSMDPDSPFPDFRPQEDSQRWFLRPRSDADIHTRASAQQDTVVNRNNTRGLRAHHTPSVDQAQQGQTSDFVSPLISQFADSVGRELSERLQKVLSNSFEAESLEHLLLATSKQGQNSTTPGGGDRDRQNRQLRRRSTSDVDLEIASSTSRAGPSNDPHHDTASTHDDTSSFEAVLDDLRQTVATIVMRLSTLEGRQRALQGKMAKLDGAWGGDASQMGLAIAELQHVVANQTPNAEFGSLRGQFFSLAHSIDKLDKRLAAIERRLGGSGSGGATAANVGGGGTGPPPTSPPPSNTQPTAAAVTTPISSGRGSQRGQTGGRGHGGN